MRRRPFLTASWRYLAMLNYRIDPALLAPYVPDGTTLDTFNGEVYISLVGFLFEDTRLLGLPVPFHRNFEELNLRFYVRRVEKGESRRAVVFIRELVPKRAIALVARLAYNEPYLAMPMQHAITHGEGKTLDVTYRWWFNERWNSVTLRAGGEPAEIAAGGEEEFIAEHYWGYTRQRNGSTLEYEVRHPRWRTWKVSFSSLDADVEALYGPVFGSVLREVPASSLLAEGSPVTVYRGRRLIL